jgi:tetratricopeptide (TPR) repeat protein
VVHGNRHQSSNPRMLGDHNPRRGRRTDLCGVGCRTRLEEPQKPQIDPKALLAKAKNGDRQAPMWLGTGYEQGWFGKPDFQQALKWYSRAAAHGDPDAQNSLGQMYENGEGVQQDYARAAYWYRKAAEHVPDLEEQVREGTIWDCYTRRVIEFPETTFKRTCGSA